MHRSSDSRIAHKELMQICVARGAALIKSGTQVYPEWKQEMKRLFGTQIESSLESLFQASARLANADRQEVNQPPECLPPSLANEAFRVAMEASSGGKSQAQAIQSGLDFLNKQGLGAFDTGQVLDWLSAASEVGRTPAIASDANVEPKLNASTMTAQSGKKDTPQSTKSDCQPTNMPISWGSFSNPLVKWLAVSNCVLLCLCLLLAVSLRQAKQSEYQIFSLGNGGAIRFHKPTGKTWQRHATGWLPMGGGVVNENQEVDGSFSGK